VPYLKDLLLIINKMQIGLIMRKINRLISTLIIISITFIMVFFGDVRPCFARTIAGTNQKNLQSSIIVSSSGKLPSPGIAPSSGKLPSSIIAPSSGKLSSSGKVPSSGKLPSSGMSPSSGIVSSSGIMPSSGIVTSSGRKIRYLESGIVVYGLEEDVSDDVSDGSSPKEDVSGAALKENTDVATLKIGIKDSTPNNSMLWNIFNVEPVFTKDIKDGVLQDENDGTDSNTSDSVVGGDASEMTDGSSSATDGKNSSEVSDDSDSLPTGMDSPETQRKLPEFKSTVKKSSVAKSVSVENFGNVTVTTTIDIGEATRTTETRTYDPATGIVTKDYVTEYVDIGNTSTWHEVIDPTNFGYIYVGDSRFLGLDMITKLSAEPNTWVYAEVSKGYAWLDSYIVGKIRETEAANPDIDKWFEIYTLGINDMGNEARYMKWYRNRAKDHNVILVSTNPIERHSSITNGRIERFNKSLKDTGIDYVDCYGYLMENNCYATGDGVHFSATTNKTIKEYVQKSVIDLAIDSQNDVR